MNHIVVCGKCYQTTCICKGGYKVNTIYPPPSNNTTIAPYVNINVECNCCKGCINTGEIIEAINKALKDWAEKHGLSTNKKD